MSDLLEKGWGSGIYVFNLEAGDRKVNTNQLRILQVISLGRGKAKTSIPRKGDLQGYLGKFINNFLTCSCIVSK